MNTIIYKKRINVKLSSLMAGAPDPVKINKQMDGVLKKVLPGPFKSINNR